MFNKPVKQPLLFRDPQPLVERLGIEFFRQLPRLPGVYLMRGSGARVLYVGKAKNLRQRLGSYRVANPDRMPRRHLRLLRAVERIDFETCADETAALQRESALLLELRPRFNRAGTWKPPERFLNWRLSNLGLELAIAPAAWEGWRPQGPLRMGVAIRLRASLARLLWCAIHSSERMTALPLGWFQGEYGAVATILPSRARAMSLVEAAAQLERLFKGASGEFCAWIGEQTKERDHPFETAARELDLSEVTELLER